jgi:N-methylhydantoinase A/oxoprolinase/acetone carboxylase beta subunit
MKTTQSRISAAHRVARPHQMIQTFFARKKIRGAVYRRAEIAAGSRLRVPCIVTEYSATTLIPEGCQARVDSWGNIIIEVGNPGQQSDRKVRPETGLLVSEARP